MLAGFDHRIRRDCEKETSSVNNARLFHDIPLLCFHEMINFVSVGGCQIGNQRAIIARDNHSTRARRDLVINTILNIDTITLAALGHALPKFIIVSGTKVEVARETCSIHCAIRIEFCVAPPAM